MKTSWVWRRRVNRAAGAILAIFFVSLASSHSAAATGSWTSGTFTFGEETRSQFTQQCTEQQVTIGTGSLAAHTATLCVYDRGDWRYAQYTRTVSPSQQSRHFVIGIGADRGMYVVNGAPIDFRILHVPGSNDLHRNYTTMDFTNNHQIDVAKNFPSKLVRITGPLGEPQYNLPDDAWQPLLQRDDGRAITTGSVDTSQDGHWMAIEITNVGLVLMDTTTGAFHGFSNFRHSYGYGNNAFIEFTISEDGKHIATFDPNITPRIYSVSSSCGIHADSISDDFLTALYSSSSCPDDGGRLETAMIEHYGSYQESRGKSANKFNYDGDTLYFQRYEGAMNDTENYKVFDTPLHAGGYAASANLEYLALGDSYASGEGDIGGKPNGTSYYSPTTNYRGGCHLSSRSYPFLLKQQNNIPSDRMQSVACSGAQVVFDYNRPLEGYLGQDSRLGYLDSQSRETQQSSSLEDFTPGKVPQLEFIRKYQPKAVTIMGGGNDIGFGSILKYCASPSLEGAFADNTCGYAVNGNDLQKMLGITIHDQYLYTRAMLAKIHEVSPQTKIYLIGYPSFITDSTAACLNSGALGSEERIMIHEGVTYTNAVLKKAAQTSNVYFIDIQNSLNGGRMCEGSEYVTGLWNIGYDLDTRSAETFHPNAKGHQKIAEEIQSQDFTINQSENPETSSDDEPPAIPEYFGSSSSQPMSVGQQQIATATELEQNSTGNELYLASYSFGVDTETNLTIYSSPTSLGTFVASDDGSLTGSFTLPDSIKPGRHVLVIEGTSPSGETIKYFQFVTVRSNDPDDTDNDGVANNIDACPYLKYWYDEQTGEDTCIIQSTIQSSSSNKADNKSSPRQVENIQAVSDIFDDKSSQNNKKSPIYKSSKSSPSSTKNSTVPLKLPNNETGNAYDDKVWPVWTIFGVIGVISVIILRRSIAKGRHEKQ